MSDHIIDIAEAEHPKTITPGIFGHFIEFLGRCINDGIWAGEDSDIPQENGLRLDIIDALQSIRAPAFRWPGGTFADCYHWQDGIGPRHERPTRRNIFWGGDESNHFGTDEYFHWCNRIGADPVLQTNLGSGSPQETLDWMDYCNGTSQSEFAKRRRMHGHEEPYGVKYWSIGNETGLQYSPEEYAHEIRRFGFYVRQAQPEAKVIVCGDSSLEWNPRLLDAIGDRLELFDLLSLHCYAHTEPAGQNDPVDSYRLLAKAAIVDEKVSRAIEVVDNHVAGRKKIDLVIDEWGVWHHEVRILPGFPALEVPNNLEQPGTMRDALYAARILHGFIRRADRIAMANISMSVNTLHCLLKTRGGDLVRTPTYHVFDMLKDHGGARTLATHGEAGTFEYKDDGKTLSLPKIDVVASTTPDGKRTIVSAVNPQLDRAETIRLHIKPASGPPPSHATASVVRAHDPCAVNDFEDPDQIVPRDALIEGVGETWTLTCAPFSLTTATFSAE